MGRTYEALSHGRVKRADIPVEDEEIAPTTVIPSFHPTPLETARTAVQPGHSVQPFRSAPSYQSAQSSQSAQSAQSGHVAHEGNRRAAETAALEELTGDNDGVPFIEVGAPKGSPPICGPQVPPAQPGGAILNSLPVHSPGVPVVKSTSSVRAAAAAPGRLRVDTPPPELPTKAADAVAVAFFPIPERRLLDPQQMSAELVAFHRSGEMFGAQYRAVLAGIAAQHPGPGCPLLIFTTVGHAVEAATVILNIAITRAREEGKRLLVIEANHDRPMLARRLGIEPEPGLRELLNRSIPLGVALHGTPQEHLIALPPGDPDLPVSHEAEARLPDVVNQLRRRFDWILVNGPEWGSGGAVEWAALGDAAYLVVKRDQWDTPEVETAHEAIIAAGGKLRGYITLHNRVER